MKTNMSNSDLINAEAKGQIHRGLDTMPEMSETAPVMPAPSEVLDNPEAFRMAIGRAQMAGEECVFVTERLMQYLSRGKDVSITYGKPGIRVYVEGAKEKCDQLEHMHYEKAYEHSIGFKR